MIRKKQGFTTMETVMVIAIVSILLLSIRNLFQSKDRDNLYAESCFNKIYGDINNFIYSAITSKGIYTGGSTIFPDQYIISIDTTQDAIFLIYKQSDGTTGIYIADILSGSSLRNNYCTANNYYPDLSGDNITVNINKWLIQDQNLQTFSLTGSTNAFTGSTKFLICYSPTTCKEVGILDIDARIQIIKKKRCLLLTGGTCIQWDQ